MKQYRILFLAVAVGTSGCTTVALDRYTVNQALQVTDLRYQEVLSCLASVADNPGVLPSFSVLGGGTSQVSDTAQLETTTVWDQAVKGFSKQTFTAMGKRNPNPNWTLDPVTSQPQMEGVRCACLWALQGPPDLCSPCMALLREPRIGEYEGYHLGVADQLARIQPGWLHVGCRRDVPKCACYSAHCNGTYVWVTRDGLQALSEFTLVFMDIATIFPPSLLLQQPVATIESSLSSTVKPIDISNGKWGTQKISETVPAKQDLVNLPDGQVLPGAITVGFPSAWTDSGPPIQFGNVSGSSSVGPTLLFTTFGQPIMGPRSVGNSGPQGK